MINGSKIFDGFTFFDELLLLELRLNELKDVVDTFILVEATKTFRGEPKPLYFKENMSRFAPFLDRIVHVVVDDFPAYNGDPWVNEHFQRNAICRGFETDKPAADDIIMISDVDEIPRPSAIHRFADEKRKFGIIEQRFFYYKINRENVSSDEDYVNTRLVRYRNMLPPQQLRELRAKEYPAWRIDRPSVKLLRDGGWHFSYLKSPEEIARKIGAFSHSEFDLDEFTDLEHIQKCIDSGEDLFKRPDQGTWEIVALDDSFPRYIVENQERFAPWIASP